MNTPSRPTFGHRVLWAPVLAALAIIASLGLGDPAQGAVPHDPSLVSLARPVAPASSTPLRTPPQAQQTTSTRTYLPAVVTQSAAANYEARALWVTRYDWTTYGQVPRPEAIDTIVDRAAEAGFNMIFFQVRAHGDAYYTPGLEPWAARLTGTNGATLGQDPGWDPLARMLERAHARGLQVHAYINVYTAWLGTTAPPHTTPEHIFWAFSYMPGSNWAYWRQWDRNHHPMNLNTGYLWASPGVEFVEDHTVAVARDIVSRYPVDGLHLDLVRYAGADYSCDPRSEERYGRTCFSSWDYAGFQRSLVTHLVGRMYTEVRPLRPNLMLSAAVWWYPIDQWGFGCSEGYNDYYQDSQAWLAAGLVDAVAPMLYGCPALEDLGNWTAVVRDFQAHSARRYVLPGISAEVNNFSAIAERIAAARAAGAAGQALFSYTSLNAHNYWDDLANGPYAQPAAPPPIP